MAATGKNFDVLIVGGGVIGLSLAWELAQHSVKVGVVDRSALGKEASWAGAGMIPPGPPESHWHVATALEQLEGLSQTLHERWHPRLLEATGIDSQYQQSGSLHLAAFTEEQVVELRSRVARWQALGIDCREIDATTVADLEPALAARAEQFALAYCLPDEAQIRNPRHLQALLAACELADVDLMPHAEVQGFATDGQRITVAETDQGSITADQICICTGCWSGQLARQLGTDLPVRPIRGQIALLDGHVGLLKRNVCVGSRYLVPRRDGLVLVGSTEEDVGFQKATTDDAINGLRDFAASVAPETAALPLRSSWSGLRPGTPGRQPILGRVPRFDNAWIATGHFRAGLQLSPATAVVMRSLIMGQESPIETSDFALGLASELRS